MNIFLNSIILYIYNYYIYIYIFISFRIIFPIGIDLLYGGEYTLYCGDRDTNIRPGQWLRDGIHLGAYGRSYTITNATFSDDGKYQCRRNGKNVYPSPLQVYVFGKSYKFVHPHGMVWYMGYHMHTYTHAHTQKIVMQIIVMCVFTEFEDD